MEFRCTDCGCEDCRCPGEIEIDNSSERITTDILIYKDQKDDFLKALDYINKKNIDIWDSIKNKLKERVRNIIEKDFKMFEDCIIIKEEREVKQFLKLKVSIGKDQLNNLFILGQLMQGFIYERNIKN